MEWPLAALVSTLVPPLHPGRRGLMAPARGPVQIVLVGFGWPLTDYKDLPKLQASTGPSMCGTDQSKPTATSGGPQPGVLSPQLRARNQVGEQCLCLIYPESFSVNRKSNKGRSVPDLRWAVWPANDNPGAVQVGGAGEVVPGRGRGCVILSIPIAPEYRRQLRLIVFSLRDYCAEKCQLVKPVSPVFIAPFYFYDPAARGCEPEIGYFPSYRRTALPAVRVIRLRSAARGCGPEIGYFPNYRQTALPAMRVDQLNFGAIRRRNERLVERKERAREDVREISFDVKFGVNPWPYVGEYVSTMSDTGKITNTNDKSGADDPGEESGSVGANTLVDGVESHCDTERRSAAGWSGALGHDAGSDGVLELIRAISRAIGRGTLRLDYVRDKAVERGFNLDTVHRCVQECVREGVFRLSGDDTEISIQDYTGGGSVVSEAVRAEVRHFLTPREDTTVGTSSTRTSHARRTSAGSGGTTPRPPLHNKSTLSEILPGLVVSGRDRTRQWLEENAADPVGEGGGGTQASARHQSLGPIMRDEELRSGPDERDELVPDADGGRGNPNVSQSSSRNNGDNNNNITITGGDGDGGANAGEDDIEMVGAFAGPAPPGSRASSTPNTKNDWAESTDGDMDDTNEDVKSRTAGSKSKGGRQKRRRACESQRLRRAREKQHQAAREQQGARELQSPDGAQQQQQQHQTPDLQRAQPTQWPPNWLGQQLGQNQPALRPGPGQVGGAPREDHQRQQQQQDGSGAPAPGSEDQRRPRHVPLGWPEHWLQQDRQQPQQQQQRQQPQQQHAHDRQPPPAGPGEDGGSVGDDLGHGTRPMDTSAVAPSANIFSSETVNYVSNAVNMRCAGGGGDALGADDAEISPFTMDFALADDHDTTTVFDQTQVFDIRELVSNDIEVASEEIRTKDVISYVVLKWDTRVDPNWTVPDPALFHDLLNRVTCEILERDLACGSIRKWTNMWGKVGLVGLSPKSTALLTEYRELVERQVVGSTKFTIFPRDGLEKKGCVSVLLREYYRHFKIELLPKEILRRTKALRGGLKVTHFKSYKAGDRSRTGASKEGWRLILLQGTAEFMSSLEAFEEEHRFPVGSDRIIIRGGKRKPPQSGAGQARAGPGPRGRGPQQQQGQQHQQQWASGSGGARTGTRSQEHNRESGTRRGSGRGSGAAGVPDYGVWGTAPPR